LATSNTQHCKAIIENPTTAKDRTMKSPQEAFELDHAATTVMYTCGCVNKKYPAAGRNLDLKVVGSRSRPLTIIEKKASARSGGSRRSPRLTFAPCGRPSRDLSMTYHMRDAGIGLLRRAGREPVLGNAGGNERRHEECRWKSPRTRPFTVPVPIRDRRDCDRVLPTKANEHCIKILLVLKLPVSNRF
jgi:hypothetical protein